MKTIQATSYQRDNAIAVEAQVIDEKGKLVFAETFEWGKDVPMKDIVRETKLLLKEKLDRNNQQPVSPVAVAGLDGAEIT
ncbi:MAG: hypothetical protein Q8R28_12450, partial [Dehalococcoidia bacterium]|nr:hypothetical protein [Dehalococcoidia bacterium]